MGITAYNNSDYVVITEEDPRDEDPVSIAKQIKGDLPDDKVAIIADRQSAIEEAIKFANKGDFVLILGKGEDLFMDRGDERQVWEGDNFVAKRILDELGAIRKAAVSN